MPETDDEIKMNAQLRTQVTELNKSGISHLENKNYDDAIQEFSQSLGLVKKVLAVLETDDDYVDCENCSSPPNEQNFYFVNCQRGAEKAVSGEPFVFEIPLAIPLDNALPCQPTAFRYCLQLIYVSLYNLALSQHLKALALNCCPKRFQKAVALYELAYQVQVNEDIDLSFLQVMALLNNLGQVHLALGNQKKSRHCFQNLLSTMMFVNHCGERGASQYMDGFLGNILPLILGSAKAAPAA